ncbi:OmpA family protein [Aquimarina sp. ERC-38]|uniref:OmpA family protein n=1 Tax=Aquimarina sp. ERC-38 TaxID=2949996 RepID=UPI00224746ED|nr:OmpA family protein [Aquimarina sp. ERC-38]UZO80374.1 OmpA family protein [Aquimarina sp. ERC-38]
MNLKYLCYSLIFLQTMGYGQKKFKNADALFEKMWYKEAAEAYESGLKNGNYTALALKNAGDAHYFNTNMPGAAKWYDILLSQFPEEATSDYYFRYAQSLKGMGDYGQAKKWMKRYTNRTSTTTSTSPNVTNIQKIVAQQPEYELKNISVNTALSDFGPMYFEDQLVYASAIDSSYYKKRTYGWNQQPYLNLFIGKLNTTGTDVLEAEEFSREINTKYHEATLAFSPDGQTLYFTRNNYNGSLKRDKEGTNHLKLYRARRSTDKGSVDWMDIEELPFNSDSYSVGHPSVSEDGTKLYFVSDMPGSIGETDIFMVDILPDNTFSSPRNLGPIINTPNREMFPFIKDEILYFASDGHLGLGGLDVFKYSFDQTATLPQNLGPGMNSNLDDFGFITKDHTTGFVCSNRKGGKGDDDIYSFEKLETSCSQSITGTVKNKKNGQILKNAKVALLTQNGTVTAETLSDQNGNFFFEEQINCSTSYVLKISKKGYSPAEEQVTIPDETGVTDRSILLETVDDLIVEENGLLKIKIGIIYFDLDKSNVRNDAAIELNKIVLLMKQYPKMKIKIASHTDARDSDAYNLDLSDQRAKATQAYIISQGISSNRIIEAIGYGETQLINKCANGIPCSESQHQLNRRSEFIIVEM